jgi:hypothetical protein
LIHLPIIFDVQVKVKVAPVAVGLKVDGVFHLASGQRLVERVSKLDTFSVRGFIEA